MIRAILRPACVIILLLTSCREENPFPVIPQEVIPMDTMALIVRDIHLVEAGINTNVFQRERFSFNRYRWRSMILETYGSDSTRLDKSFTWYQDHPLAFDSVYNLAIESLNGIESGREP